jgi:hypothetical protein
MRFRAHQFLQCLSHFLFLTRYSNCRFRRVKPSAVSTWTSAKRAPASAQALAKIAPGRGAAIQLLLWFSSAYYRRIVTRCGRVFIESCGKSRKNSRTLRQGTYGKRGKARGTGHADVSGCGRSDSKQRETGQCPYSILILIMEQYNIRAAAPAVQVDDL